MIRFTLANFVRESNRIEGILRDPSAAEVAAHERFLVRAHPNVADLELLVSVIQPGAKLRREAGMDVRVGNHVPPPGSPEIPALLDGILKIARLSYPYDVHQAYETLHPFTDGNGRSGRALWLWMMGGIDNAPLGFLHSWYYQSLSNGRSK